MKVVNRFRFTGSGYLIRTRDVETESDGNETRVPSSKQEENETNYQKYRFQPGRKREETGNKPVLVPGFSTKVLKITIA